MKYVAILRIENNKSFIKYDNAEELAEHFIMWKNKFKNGSNSKIVIEYMDYPTYRARKEELRKGLYKVIEQQKEMVLNE